MITDENNTQGATANTVASSDVVCVERSQATTGQSFAAPLLLGDVVYLCNNGGGMYRLTDCGNESYDLFSWNGEDWSFKDNIGFESAKIRLKNSWEVYVRAVI